MEGRRWSEGLHQAVEAKEGVKIQEEHVTLATITLQNYFRLYEKLAGMTGTAKTEEKEFVEIYDLNVVEIPTNVQVVRDDKNDLIFKTNEAKFDAVVKDIIERKESGQPVLVGTIAVETSEHLAELLTRRGVPHNVLNAKEHEREAEIIKDAGQRGAVTIATNMAGRGVDIKLGEGVVDLGGLYVLGTERHEARRIDNQLRGRSGRQGDPGETRFYLSGEDDLVRLFAGDRIKNIMERFKLPDDQPMEAKILSNQIEGAQKKVEEQNFVMRKNVLKYDDVMNAQRMVIYEQRRRVLEGADLREEVLDWIDEVIANVVAAFTQEEYAEEWDLDALTRGMADLYGSEITADELREDYGPGLTREALVEDFQTDARERYAAKEEEFGADPETETPIMRELERFVILQVVDVRWREHLENMDYLREGVHLRAMAQKDPLVEYRGEGHQMFEALGARSTRRSSRCSSTRRSRSRRRPSSSRRRLPRGNGAPCATSTKPSRARMRSRRARAGTARRWLRPRSPEACQPSPARSRRSRSSSRSRSRSAATTRAGAAAARSSRSATAPDARKSGSGCSKRRDCHDDFRAPRLLPRPAVCPLRRPHRGRARPVAPGRSTDGTCRLGRVG